MLRYLFFYLLFILPAKSNNCYESINYFLSAGNYFHAKYTKLHTKTHIEITAKKMLVHNQKIKLSPSLKIASWFEYLHGLLQKGSYNPKIAQRIRSYYHKKYLIKMDDIPMSHFKNLKRIHEERGEIFPEITQDFIKHQTKIIINNQKESLDKWIDYFLSPDSNSFPIWAKFWALDAVTKMGLQKMIVKKGHKEKTQTYSKRTRNQIAPFPELNREVLAKVMGMFMKIVNKESLDELEHNDFLRISVGTNFSKMYSHEMYKFKKNHMTPNNVNSIIGNWIKYEKNSDPTILVNSLNEKNTGWCSAETATAEHQIKRGDFYIYYTLDQNALPTFPRIAIRMEGEHIAEIRGIAEDQNLDEVIAGTDILAQKLKEFGDEGENYFKKLFHMKRLTDLYKRYQLSQNLNKEDLKFIYEVDEKIQSFGYDRDKRIEKILIHRNIKEDLSFLFNVSKDKISTNKEEALSGNILYHYGNLILEKEDYSKNLPLPKYIFGSLDLSLYSEINDLELSTYVSGDLYLDFLEHYSNLILPEYVGGDVEMGFIYEISNLNLPKNIGGTLNLESLKIFDERIVTQTKAKKILLRQKLKHNLPMGYFSHIEWIN